MPGAEYEFAAWRTLAEVANCDVYLPIIAALSRVASHCQRGTPTISLVDVADGAMRARRIVALPHTHTPSSVPSAWPSQLHYLEAVAGFKCPVESGLSGNSSGLCLYRRGLWHDLAADFPCGVTDFFCGGAECGLSLWWCRLPSGQSGIQCGHSAVRSREQKRTPPISKQPKQPKWPLAASLLHALSTVPWAIRKLAKEPKPIIAVIKLHKAGLP